MILLLYIYAFTIVSAVRTTVIRRDYPSINRRYERYPILQSGYKRSIVPLHLHPSQKFLNPVYIPRKVDHLNAPLYNGDKRHLRAHSQSPYPNSDWVSTVPIAKNVYPVLPQQVNLPNLQFKLPINPTNFPSIEIDSSARRSEELKSNSQPTIAQPAFTQAKYLQPKILPADLSEQINVLPDSAIKPNIAYTPFLSDIQQTTSNNFLTTSFGRSADPFLISPTKSTLSPIFDPLYYDDNPERTRKAFLEKFNIEEFLDQQKLVAPVPTQSLPSNLKNDPFVKYFDDFKTVNKNYIPENHKADRSILYNNYRDDKTHESSDEQERDNEELEVEREEHEQAPRVVQDTPQDVPTKPLYPGEGYWAKKGIKHKPYLKKFEYDKEAEPNITPNGYDTFQQGEQLFNNKRDKFENQLNELPVKQNLGEFLSPDDSNDYNSHEEQVDDTSSSEDEDEFVPTKLYAQVRHSENQEHLPSDDAEDGRLKELIRDSKIQTVYTEEGYEDVGYDHEGHEKLAENEEGFQESDREFEQKEEKKIPIQKVEKELTSYTKGDEFMTDEEIEADKASILGDIEDSDAASSQYRETSGLNVVDPAKQDKKGKKKKLKLKEKEKKKHNTKDYISTKEIKTMTTKDNVDGNMEMEITGEVKVIRQPTNSSESQEFIKKLPTIHRIMEPVNEENVFTAKIEEVLSENLSENSPTDIEGLLSTTYQPPEIESVEIPMTTLPTTAIPKNIDAQSNSPHELGKIDEAFSKTDSKVRRKRFTNDFPEINVDTDFISKISHQLGLPKQDLTFKKYPYYKTYKILGLNQNSPLRYAEDMNNIPQKRGDNMAFYEQAESRVRCPAIASTVEPIPERIIKADKEGDKSEEENEDVEDESVGEIEEEEEAAAQESQTKEVHQQPKTPRLNGLGDKIDCLKAMYFGENPLDSPFFQEETVGPVLPIFNDFKKNFAKENKLEETTQITRPDQQVDHTIERFKISPQITDNGNTGQMLITTEKPKLVNLVEKAQIEDKIPTLKPVIVDNGDVGKINKSNNSIDSQSRKNLEPIEPHLMTTPNYKIDLKPKNIYDQIHLLNYLPDEANETLDANSDAPHAEKLVSWGSNSLDSVRMAKLLQEQSSNNTDPEALALKKRRRTRIRHKPPPFQIFDINRYLPTTPYPMYGHFLTTTTATSTTTTSPKPKLVSEVFYKNDINAKEQMNVFTDILNNIKTSSEDKIDKVVNTGAIPNQFNFNSKAQVYLNNQPKKLFNQNSYGQDSYLKAFQNMEIEPNYYSTITSTAASPLPTYEVTETISSTPHPTKIIEIGNMRRLVVFLPATKKTILTATSTTSKPQFVDEIPVKMNSLVTGLHPPKSHNFLHPFKRDNSIFDANPGSDTADKIVNRFFFKGMKPPPLQKLYVYSDFIQKYPPRKRKHTHRRNKRSANRSYGSLSRRKNSEPAINDPTTTTEAEDDYVPHRSKNYYYDEKLGKIVYLNQNNNQEEEEEYEDEVPIVYEPQEERKKTKSTTPKQSILFATATPPPQGQSYIDFVKKLKSASNYHEIPDPVSTEASQEVTVSVNALATLSTTPPAFLNILAKVRSDSSYKSIPDPEEKKSKKKTTTAAPEEQELEEIEEDEEQETYQGNIKNSGGGDIIGDNFQIFDITEYIPKLKNYLPRTPIDTSKYKTIERPSHRTTASDEQEIAAVTESSKVQENVLPNPDRNEELKIIVEEDVTKETSISSSETPTRRPQTIRQRTRRPFRTTFTTTSLPASTEASRNNARRKLRARTRTTTAKYLDEAEESSLKVIRRRSSSEEQEAMEDVIKAKEATTQNQNENSNIKVFQKYDPNIKHGGNYRKIVSEEDFANNNQDILGGSEVHHSSNTDKSQVVKDVKIFKKYDPNQKHGGNYKKMNEELVINGGIEGSDKLLIRIQPDVEVISQYNVAQKHGGNYKSENSTGYENLDEVKPQVMVPTNNEDKLAQESKTIRQKPEDSKPMRLILLEDYFAEPSIERLKKLPTKQRKKQYKFSSHVSRLTDIIPKPETYFTDPNLPLAVNMLVETVGLPSEEVEKLAISKEDSDDTLPIDQSDESKESYKNNMNGTTKKHETNIKSPHNRQTLFIETGSNGSNKQRNGRYVGISKNISTQKPLFIKDPSKRLYFYAPV